MTLLRTIKFIIDHPLNRGHKVKSMIRFAKWQIGSRLLSFPVVYEWVNGTKMLVKNGETGLTGNVYTGLHEFSDMGYMLHFLRAGDLFADVGANVGSYTILASGVAKARSVSFEPVPSTFSRFVDNIRINHIDEMVVAVNSAVGDQIGSISFTTDRDTVNHATVAGEKCAKSALVNVTTLDEYFKVECPSLIKIDVEGYEFQVLKGAQETLKNPKLKSIIVEINDSCRLYGYSESETITMMVDNGFRAHTYDPLSRTLTEIGGRNLMSGNTIYIRDKITVLERVTTTGKISVNGNEF